MGKISVAFVLVFAAISYFRVARAESDMMESDAPPPPPPPPPPLSFEAEGVGETDHKIEV